VCKVESTEFYIDLAARIFTLISFNVAIEGAVPTRVTEIPTLVFANNVA